MSSRSTNFLRFNGKLTLGNKKKSGEDKSGKYENSLILESLVFAMHYEVSPYHARGT
jgi:hypothetical protein